MRARLSSHVSRYVLRELLKPFGFFVVVFTGVIWLTQSLRVVDTVVNSGQSAAVFLQFSVLLLPTALGIVLPIAAFAATLYAVNKLFMDSEIVAMTAAGMSGPALARPVAVFGVGVALAATALTLYLAPLANGEMRARVHELRADVANALIFEGRFLHPAAGLTVFVGDNAGAGVLKGVFVHDRREPRVELTYTAREAVLSRTAEGPRLVMFDGAAQRRDMTDGTLSVLRFESLVFDLAQFIRDGDDRALKPSERDLRELLWPAEDAARVGRLLAEGHDRLSAPLYGLALPLLGLAAILAPGFTRRGYAGRVALAVALGAGLRLAGLAAKSATGASAALWPLLYAPPLLGIAAALWALSNPGIAGFRRLRTGGAP